MKNTKKKFMIPYRIIAGILTFCMVFEAMAMPVAASEYAYSNDSNYNSTEPANSDNDLDSRTNEPSSPDAASGDSDSNSDASDENSNNFTDTDTGNPEAVPDEPTDGSGSENTDADKNTNTNENTDTDENTDADKNADTDEPSEDINPEEETDINSNEEETDYNAGEDDNELNEADDNSSDRSSFDDIADAEQAFADIVSNKNVMALIYLTDVYHVRSLADENSDIIADLESGHTVYLLGVTITPNKIWYKVQFFVDGALMEGYVERRYLAYSDEDWLKWDAEYLYKLADSALITQSAIGGISTYASSYADVAQFPAGYQSDLTKLKQSHPNWTFVPMNTKLDFETAVTSEMGDKSLIQNTESNASKGWVGAACPTEAGWYYAKRDAVSYYMDPRNFLTETYIFQFEQLTFNSSYHTEDAIQVFLNSTFMKGTLSDDSQNRTYAQAFYEIGSKRKLSPIHLASRVYLEQGQGKSGLISGTYPGYEGYYNYFNVGVNGSTEAEKIVKGLTYAKNQGWNTRYKSLEGGASTIGNNYILKGQDTIYLEKFNVESSSPYGLYQHQYMQNIQAPASESSSTRKMYAGANSLNSAFVFKIPVYNNMPGNVEIFLDKEALTLRRPDTVVEDTSHLNDEELNSNTSTAQLHVSFVPEDTLEDKTIVWTSSNKKVATVNDGVVTAVGMGEAVITAKASNAGNASAQCKVTVIAPVYKIEFSSENNADTILAGQSINLSAEYFPKDTTSDTTVSWKSSDTSVITVARTQGTVRGISAGTADITATIGGYSASHTITVEACTVTFMDADNKTKLKTISTVYGDSILQKDFPSPSDINSADGSVFIGLLAQNDESGSYTGSGWYTGIDGSGSRFDYGTQINQKDTILYPCMTKMERDFYVFPVGDWTYTGSAIKPEVVVYDSLSYVEGALSDNSNNKPGRLTLNRDYTVSYKNNKKAAAADSAKAPTITVKGKGNYSGTQTITFNIVTKSLTESDITFDNFTTAYTGKVIKGSPVIYRDGKKLKKNTDYKLTYPQSDAGAYQNYGTYPIIVTGTGGYHGTITVYETISKKILLSKASIAKIPNQSYDPDKIADGSGIKPALTVTYKKQPLTESTDGGVTGDYYVTYKNNFNAGTATATITAVDRTDNIYIGSKSINFKIAKTSISKAVVSGVEPKTYTGMDNDVKQNEENISVKLAGELLTQSTDNGKTGDYIIDYNPKSISKAGTATLIITGINKYTGTKKVSYKITACDFAQLDTAALSISYHPENSTKDSNENDSNDEKNIKVNSLNDIASPYVKGGAKPVITLYYKDRKLIDGQDYTVKYKNNNAVTTENMPENKLPMITIAGKGLFKGKISGNFRITDGAMSDDNKVTMTAKDIVYKAKKGFYKTSVVLTDVNGKKLQAGKDYEKTLSYTYAEDISMTNTNGETITRHAGDEVGADDLPDIGTAIRITVKGIGAYAGGNDSDNDTYADDVNTPASKSAIYHIVSADISKAKVTVANKTYNSGDAPVKLSEDDITVTLNGNKLTYGVDYEIENDTYVRNDKKGKASVTIKGKGNYGGTKKINFTIAGKPLIW